MKRAKVLTAALFLVVGWVQAQPPGTRAPIADYPKAEIQGKIEKIQIAPGQGMPYMEVKSGEATTRVQLGSFRYLMEQNFNPKAGDEVTVTGYQMKSQLVAITVTAQGKVLKLRDENGWPVWVGGRRGGGMRGRWK
jgi:hypothetical protein